MNGRARGDRGRDAGHRRRPLIGVTGHRQRISDGGPPSLIAAGEAYLAAVRAAGGLPLVLTPIDAGGPGGDAELDDVLDAVDGLLFTGGLDVDPRHFGQAVLNETVTLEPDRDAFELPLIRAALARDLPVLAICRGCQVLNVALGGSLWQDLPAQRPQGVLHRQKAARDVVTHAVHIQDGSLLASVLGQPSQPGQPGQPGSSVREPVLTNTFHHQAVRDVAEGLVAVAFAADGTVEAVEAPPYAFVLGVQWHPEHLAVQHVEHRRLFQALITAAASPAAAAATGRLPSTAGHTA